MSTSTDHEAQESPRPNRHERRRRAALERKSAVVIADDDRVHSFDDCADAADLSPATFRRLIARGDGPITTRLSERRRGVRGRHYCEWLNSRAEQRMTAASQ